MKLLAVYFNRNGLYSNLRKVFELSAQKHMPNIATKIVELPMPPKKDHKRDTATAFIAAAKYVLTVKEPVIVCDIDLMFVGDVAEGMRQVVDVGVTTREGFKHPYNSGVWFYRPTNSAAAFVEEWVNNTRYYVDTFESNYEFIHQHGGIDQAALAKTVQENESMHKACITNLPCKVWNAEQSSWRYMTANTRVVHIKSGLRRACLSLQEPKTLLKQWPDKAARGAVISEFRDYLHE